MAQKFAVYVQEDIDKMTLVKTIDVGILRQCIAIPIGFVQVNFLTDQLTFYFGDSRLVYKGNPIGPESLDFLVAQIKDYEIKQDVLKEMTENYLKTVDERVYATYGYHTHSQALAAQKLRSIIKTTLAYNKRLKTGEFANSKPSQWDEVMQSAAESLAKCKQE